MTTSFSDLLASAVNEPGVISKAYSAFHGYSMGASSSRGCSVSRAAFSQGLSRRSWAGRRKGGT